MTDSNESKDITQITDLSEMIERLKNNPEIVSSVASALGLGESERSEGKPSDPPAGELPEMLSVFAPLLSKGGGEKHHDNNRTTLLLALRPYLNHERQEIIDYIIKFSKMGDILKKLK